MANKWNRKNVDRTAITGAVFRRSNVAMSVQKINQHYELEVSQMNRIFFKYLQVELIFLPNPADLVLGIQAFHYKE